MGQYSINFIQFFLPLFIVAFFLIKNRWLASFIIILAYFLGMAEFLSCNITGDNLYLSTLLRIDSTMLDMTPTVLGALFYRTCFYTLLMFMFVYLKMKENFHKKIFYLLRLHWCYRLILIIICMIPMVSSLTVNTYVNIFNDYNEYRLSKNYSLNDIISQLGGVSYLSKNEVVAHPGKNIIVIYCESFDDGYLDNELFPDLMPKLHKMIEQGKINRYTNYIPMEGANWTVGALYATHTSFPCIVGHGGNSIFKNVSSSSAVSYANVLQAAGYNTLFLSAADLNFAGTGSMMELLGYKVKNYDAFNVDTEKTYWGVHDLDLFKQAKISYDLMKRSETPFCITLLTCDTHFPDGLPDKRLSNNVKIDLNGNSMEYSIASLDYLLSDFIDYVYTNSGDENTEIVILGDHPVMGSKEQTATVGKLEQKTRKVALLTTINTEKYSKNDKIYFWNIPDFILSGINVGNNAIFADKLFNDMNKEKIEKNRSLFMQLNLKLIN